MCATYGDTWTSQLFVLADYYNVEKASPGFAEKYTANEAHYADTPAAQAGFKHLQEAHDKGWYQKDFGADKFDKGQELLATGKCAHYPMLTFAVGTAGQQMKAATTSAIRLRNMKPPGARESGEYCPSPGHSQRES